MQAELMPAPATELDDTWFVLRSGIKFHALSPRIEEIFISDIAFALGNIPRFAGHVQFVSVAEHSCRVADHLPPALKLMGLLHDAPEGLGLMDMPRPIKYSSLMVGYRQIEALVWAAVAEKFALPKELPSLVKEIDNRALLAERNHLMDENENTRGWDLDGFLTPLPCFIHCWPPVVAQREFMKRYNELTK